MLKHVTLACLLASAAVLAQESKPIPKDSVEVTARGCFKGRVFTGTGQPEGEGVVRGPDITGHHFRVSAPRDVMNVVKQNDGHLVEIVGIVRKAALDNQGMGLKVGGARVVIGAPGQESDTHECAEYRAERAGDGSGHSRFVSDRCPESSV